MSNRYYLGVDPGGNGGAALFRDDEEKACAVYASLPDVLKNVERFHRWLSGLPKKGLWAFIETIVPGGFFGVGKSSAAKLYGSYTSLFTVLMTSGIPTNSVSAEAWQSGLDIPQRRKGESKYKWKQRLKRNAIALFPDDKDITDSTADAYLIAEFCRRIHA